jgi:hypothetical protein
MTQIPLSDAIQQLRDQLREAMLEGKDQDKDVQIRFS